MRAGTHYGDHMDDSTKHLNLEADLLVIGWGKAGKTLARDLASAGKRVVLVERDDSMAGGTCINVACVPTKTLVNRNAAGSRPRMSTCQRPSHPVTP